MANKKPNFDFSGAMNRMRKTTKEEPVREAYEVSTYETAYAAPEEPAQEEKGRVGRKKKEHNVRSNPKTIFFDDETDRALSMIKLNNSIDKKDLVLAATRIFLAKYYNRERHAIDSEAIRLVFETLGKSE